MQRRSASGLAWVGVAAAGLLLGHWFAYLLSYQQIHLRDVVLAQTGHSYLAPAAKLVSVFVFVALGWLATEAWTHRKTIAGLPARFGPIAIRLMGIQLVGFSALEILERILAHVPVLQMFGHYTFALGLLMQVITALTGAVVVLLITRTAEQVRLFITGARRPRRRGGSSLRTGFLASIALPRGLLGAAGVRGPPQVSTV